MPNSKESQFQKDHVLELNQAIHSGSLYQVRQMIKTLPTAGIAHLLESSPPRTRSVLWQLVDKDAEGEVIQYLNEDLQNEILSDLNAEEVAELTEGLEDDDLADILQQLPQQLATEVLQAMDLQDRQRVETILSYDEDTAGGLMNTDTITVRRNHTVELVLRYLRRHDSIPEMTDNLLVVNRSDEFLGILPLREVLVSDPNISVREVMHEDVEAIPVDMEANQVAQLFEQHDWVSAPVVDSEGKLLGRITIDDVVDVIRDSTEHSLMSMAGLDEEDDTFAPGSQDRSPSRLMARRKPLYRCFGFNGDLSVSGYIGPGSLSGCTDAYCGKYGWSSRHPDSDSRHTRTRLGAYQLLQ
jgi:magnesium transporter